MDATTNQNERPDDVPIFGHGSAETYRIAGSTERGMEYVNFEVYVPTGLLITYSAIKARPGMSWTVYAATPTRTMPVYEVIGQGLDELDATDLAERSARRDMEGAG